MENKAEDETAAAAVPSKWRTLVRQQSQKIGQLADTVVLPKNERTIRHVSNAESMEMQTDEAGHSSTYDVNEKQSTEHFPAFMIGISVVQIILFYSFDENLWLTLGYDPHRRHEIWRFVTVMLVHSSCSHLWGNVIMQLVLGVFLEIVHQWKRIAIIYLASVFGGSLSVTVLDNASYSVGASAGVMGLLFSHLATIILNWNEMDRKFSRLFCVSLYIVCDVGTDLYNELVIGNDSNTSHAGHFGGAVTGFLVSIFVLKNFKKHPWEKTMQKLCVGCVTTIFVIVVVFNVTATDYFPVNEWNFDYERTFYEELLNATDESTEMYDED